MGKSNLTRLAQSEKHFIQTTRTTWPPPWEVSLSHGTFLGKAAIQFSLTCAKLMVPCLSTSKKSWPGCAQSTALFPRLAPCVLTKEQESQSTIMRNTWRKLINRSQAIL